MPADDLTHEIARLRGQPRGRPNRPVPPGPGQESVWDYPRPPRMEPVAPRVRVELAGVTLAESDRALRVLETASPPTIYIPPEDVRTDLLEPAKRSTLCEWKGTARYWTARVGDRVAHGVAWSYPNPLPSFEALRHYLAFFPGRVDACYLGNDRVQPQPGDYYGGWITPNIVGPFKGDPGTQGW